ncbi:hypothetical protein U1Q18_004811 [Sarracenia purpurea var. burkii]
MSEEDRERVIQVGLPKPRPTMLGDRDDCSASIPRRQLSYSGWRRVWRSIHRRSSSFSIAVFASAAAGSIEATVSEPAYRSPHSERRQILVLKSGKAGVEPGVGRSSDSSLDLNLGSEKKEVMKAESLAAGVGSWTLGRSKPSGARVLQSGGDAKLQGKELRGSEIDQ